MRVFTFFVSFAVYVYALVFHDDAHARSVRRPVRTAYIYWRLCKSDGAKEPCLLCVVFASISHKMPEIEVEKDLIFVRKRFLNKPWCTLFIAHHIQDESDLPHEEEILRHPFQLKCWLRYIEHKSSAPKAVINLIYERALKQLPGR